MSKTPPNFLFPTNFRNGKSIKRLIKDFNVQGYGIAVYLLETLSETEEHKFPIEDIDLLADEMKVSVPVISTVINSYGLFEIVEDENGTQFISTQLNKWLEPYYKQVEQRSIAGKLSAAKRKKKQQEQIKQLEINLSESDSTQRPLNDRSTIKEINKEIKKKRNKEKRSVLEDVKFLSDLKFSEVQDKKLNELVDNYEQFESTGFTIQQLITYSNDNRDYLLKEIEVSFKNK